ncbi:ABC transporter ATP-binding protein [Salipiger mangrovisoli]|uniref:Sn-glycerol-3-phosphate ABC transporter ATP-binding protein UgpC n=1 Tax=Salipiger mangrovisoli TaxID=2865933 RepID=A0ABR9X5V9_9RHOB|nr:sn-glycerol-3-phosphate ABC transporter ATP-binding protein UgpC [Salipiger mangrovisoli]MBE9638827.1 sn-glycerol-3-phosphate ABC transporter ATP-binding protein UgpC [Salipiger mangrovisoli]
MARLQLKNVHKRWGAYVGVDDFDLDIADQEFLVLLGPSGCGKSTTMRMIAGLEDVTEGEIWLGDRMVNKLEPKDRDISMVFQSYGLYPNLTVYENIRFPLRVRKVPKEQHHEMVMRAIEMVELKDFMDRRPAELSGGQRQRVALGRAIVRKPTVFLMDEPLSNLDAKLRVSTRAQIKNLQSKLKTTTVYVTHDQIEAMTLADRVVVMNKGRIQQVGTPTEIYDNPANTFVASFIGSPAMNLVEGRLADGVFTSEGIRVEGLRRDVTADVTLGFRAEDSVIAATGGQIAAPIYSIELLGEASMISWRLGGSLISVRAPKDFRAEIGETICASVPAEICHLFDTASGQRLA